MISYQEISNCKTKNKNAGTEDIPLSLRSKSIGNIRRCVGSGISIPPIVRAFRLHNMALC